MTKAMTKNEVALATAAILFGAVMERSLKNFDLRQFVVKIAEHSEISQAMFEHAAIEIAQFFEDFLEEVKLPL
jgi:hypothetical protein